METLLCYFYSTIPQVLSGAIGLFGVFCLYKLNLIRDSLKGLTESMVLELEIGEYYREVKQKEEYKKKFDQHIRRLKIAATQSNVYKMRKALYDSYDFIIELVHNTNMIEQIITPFQSQLKTRNKLILFTKISLIYTGILIFFCVIIIPHLRSILTICPYLTMIVISLFVVNLIIIIGIVFISVDTYNEIKNI